MTFGPITAAVYLAIGLGLTIAFLLNAAEPDSRKHLVSGWYTITGDRNLPAAVVTLTLVALLLWPVVAAVWVLDFITERRSR